MFILLLTSVSSIMRDRDAASLYEQTVMLLIPQRLHGRSNTLLDRAWFA